MIDYTAVKKFYAMKLYEDAIGDDRVEYAFFHTMKMVYLQGVEDGQKSLKKDVGIIDGKRSREIDT